MVIYENSSRQGEMSKKYKKSTGFWNFYEMMKSIFDMY